jgi:hypothetical protein
VYWTLSPSGMPALLVALIRTLDRRCSLASTSQAGPYDYAGARVAHTGALAV